MPKYKVKPKDLRSMSPEKRKELLEQFRKELITIRYKAKVGALKETAKIRELRRNIARILTILKEEEIKARSTR
ncbi:MAG: 50S ribosomal protein L29 [Acidilobaceae archaeon]